MRRRGTARQRHSEGPSSAGETWSPAYTGPPGTSLGGWALSCTGPWGDQPRRPDAELGRRAGPWLRPLRCLLFNPESESRRLARPRQAEMGGGKGAGRLDLGEPAAPGKGRAHQGPRPERAMRGHLRPPGEVWTSVLLQAVQAWPRLGQPAGTEAFVSVAQNGGLLAWVTGSLGLGGALLSLWRGARIQRGCSTFAKALSPQGTGHSPARGAHRNPSAGPLSPVPCDRGVDAALNPPRASVALVPHPPFTLSRLVKGGPAPHTTEADAGSGRPVLLGTLSGEGAGGSLARGHGPAGASRSPESLPSASWACAAPPSGPGRPRRVPTCRRALTSDTQRSRLWTRSARPVV